MMFTTYEPLSQTIATDEGHCPCCRHLGCSPGCPLDPVDYEDEDRIIEAMLSSFPTDDDEGEVTIAPVVLTFNF